MRSGVITYIVYVYMLLLVNQSFYDFESTLSAALEMCVGIRRSASQSVSYSVSAECSHTENYRLGNMTIRHYFSLLTPMKYFQYSKCHVTKSGSDFRGYK